MNHQADLVTNKTLYIDGKKVGGAMLVNIDCDVRNSFTAVSVKFSVKKGSLKMSSRKISFSTVNEAFK